MTPGGSQVKLSSLPIWSSLFVSPPPNDPSNNTNNSACCQFLFKPTSLIEKSPIRTQNYQFPQTPQTTPPSMTTKSLLTTPTQFPDAYLFGSPTNANTSLISQSPKVLVSNHQLLLSDDLKQLNLYDQNNNNDSEANQNKSLSSTTTMTMQNEFDDNNDVEYLGILDVLI